MQIRVTNFMRNKENYKVISMKFQGRNAKILSKRKILIISNIYLQICNTIFRFEQEKKVILS